MAPSCQGSWLGDLFDDVGLDNSVFSLALDDPVPCDASLAPSSQRARLDHGLNSVDSRVGLRGGLGLGFPFDDPVPGDASLAPPGERNRVDGVLSCGIDLINRGVLLLTLDDPVPGNATLAPSSQGRGFDNLFGGRGGLSFALDDPVSSNAALAPAGPTFRFAGMVGSVEILVIVGQHPSKPSDLGRGLMTHLAVRIHSIFALVHAMFDPKLAGGPVKGLRQGNQYVVARASSKRAYQRMINVTRVALGPRGSAEGRKMTAARAIHIVVSILRRAAFTERFD